MRVGQPAQGRGAERRADRRDAGGPGPSGPPRGLTGNIRLAWLWLAGAGLFEVVWVVLLKQTDGFTRLIPSVATVAALAASFFCMSQSLRSLPMGTVYAVWTGIGAAGAASPGASPWKASRRGRCASCAWG